MTAPDASSWPQVDLEGALDQIPQGRRQAEAARVVVDQAGELRPVGLQGPALLRQVLPGGKAAAVGARADQVVRRQRPSPHRIGPEPQAGHQPGRLAGQHPGGLVVAMGIVRPGRQQGRGARGLGDACHPPGRGLEDRAAVGNEPVGEVEKVQGSRLDGEVCGSTAGFLLAQGPQGGGRMAERSGVRAGAVAHEDQGDGAPLIQELLRIEGISNQSNPLYCETTKLIAVCLKIVRVWEIWK